MRKIVYCIIITLFLGNVCFSQNNVIEDELKEIINKTDNEKIYVNIIFKNQLDRKELNAKTENISDKQLKREIVVEELKRFSKESQADVLNIINNESSKGNADDVRCHWLSNHISCKLTKEVIELLSHHEDILMIGYNGDKPALMSTEANETEKDADITENVLKVNADKVWDMGYTGEEVLVAILDTGVNYEHPDLADHLWDGGSQYPNHGYNSYENSNVTMDARGHGTHCAGTICGDGTSGTRTGVAPNATLMCIKALNDNGNTNATAICSGMEFAVEHGADVLSMSLGIANSSVSDRTILRQTCVNTLETGIVASVAAGNEGGTQSVNPIPNNVRVPGSCPPPWIHPDQEVNAGETSCVISVGATKSNDDVAGLSSRGPVTWQNTSFADYPYNPGIGLIRPDICAPGIDIVSLDYSSNRYVEMSGTSMAAPCVAGVICLMLSKDSTLTPEEISMLIETTCYKASEPKNNNIGSGRIDALAAVNAINMGNIVFNELQINDENGNKLVNPGETINLDIQFENISSENINNITATLICENEWINISKPNIEINSIDANGIINIEDAFTFSVSELASPKTKLFFDVEFYQNDNKISTTRFTTQIFGSDIKYSSIIVENDDNNNGLLEAGETADLIIGINNGGNEIALDLSAVLSSDNPNITVNTDEAVFNSIAPNGSGTAVFNVTLSGNASSDESYIFDLEVKDRYNKTKSLEIEYKHSCNIVYQLEDGFGDGWNGAKIIANYSDGSESDEYTVESGYTASFTKTLNSGVEVTLDWKNGGMDSECSYVISYENGVKIYSGKGRQSEGFFNWTYDCSCQNMMFQTCEGVKDFNILVYDYDVELRWNAPETESAISYEIYRNTELIANTEELSYTDENLQSGTYLYNVRPVYENCYGSLSSMEITYNVNVEENNNIIAAIYPNPSNDRFIVKCENMTEITVFNILGEIILNDIVSNDIYEINDLKEGMYFVNIKTNNANTVKKIIKY